jgi:hypothetical protein
MIGIRQKFYLSLQTRFAAGDNKNKNLPYCLPLVFAIAFAIAFAAPAACASGRFQILSPVPQKQPQPDEQYHGRIV